MISNIFGKSFFDKKFIFKAVSGLMNSLKYYHKFAFRDETSFTFYNRPSLPDHKWGVHNILFFQGACEIHAHDIDYFFDNL